jgi:HEAT repeat protein
VREAVLKREGEADSLMPCAQTALVRDTWPFVRVSAAHTLARGKPSTQVDASLGVALADPSTDVRVAAANALGERRATTQSKALIARLSDGKEDSLVRVAAARALGNSCAGDAVPALTSFAKDAALPQGAGQDVAVSMAAILALGAIHPPDVQSRLAPLLQKGVPTQARAAAQHAIAEPGSCAAH